MDPGTAIAVGQVSAKILSMIWKYYSEVQDAKSNVTYLANEIQDLHNVMQKLQGLLQDDSMATEVPVLASLSGTIEQSLLDIKLLQKKLDPGTGDKLMKRVGKRLEWPLRKKEVDDWVAKFQRFKSTVNLALNTDQTSLIIDVGTNVIQLKRGQEAIEQERQLGNLPLAAEASFDSYHRQYESQCIANTRVELLQQLQTWGTNHQRPIFWLSGMAGTGKSTIARTLANNFKSKKMLGGSFFFSRGSGEANNAVRFVGTLAYHLADTSPQLKECICEAVSLHRDATRQGLRNQWKDFVIGPLSRTKFNQRPTLNFVIDALDECDSDDDIRLLLQLFVEVKDLNTIDLGIFVTSRPEIVVRLGFKDIPEITHHSLNLHDIPRRTVEHDIYILLEQGLGRISLRDKLHEWPSEDNIRSLVQKAHRLFLYAATACRFIGDTNWDPKERLSEVLQGDSAGGGDTAKLDEMYMQVLRSSLTKVQHEGEIAKLCERFRQIMGYIVALFDELSVSALAQLLSMSVKAVDLSLGTMHSVLNIPSDLESPIRLHHPSFRDFLLNEARCGDKRFYVEEALIHSKLVTSCLQAISVALNRNSCHLPTPGSSPQDIQTETLNKHLPKHVQYACQYWVNHLTGTKSDLGAQHGLYNNGPIHKFFQNDFLHWLEAMSLIGKMTQGVLMISKLANMVELSEHHALHAMVGDAERFILSNRAIIEKAPLQVYASALVFGPAESLIRKRYSDQLPTWLVRLPAVEDRWGDSMQTLEGHGDCISAVAFSHDGKYLASSSYDKTVRLWDPATGALRSTLERHDKYASAVAFSRDGHLASASEGGKVRLWDPVTCVTCRILDCGIIDSSSGVYPRGLPLLFLPNGDLIVDLLDGNVRIWSWRTNSLSKLTIPDLSVRHLLCSSPQGTLAVKVNRKNSNVARVMLYDPTTGAAQSLKIDSPAESCAVASSSDNNMALGFPDGTIELHDSATGFHRKLRAHLEDVTALAFSPDGRFLASGSVDKNLRLWDLSTQAQSRIGRYPSDVRFVAFSPDGKQIAAVGSFSPTVKLWNTYFGATGNSREKLSIPIQHISLSCCGDQIASISGQDEMIRLYDIVSGKLDFTLADHSGKVVLIKFSHDGQQLASASTDGTTRIKDSRTGMTKDVLSNDLGIVKALVFSSDSKQLASGGHKGVQIWNPETGYLRLKLECQVKGLRSTITFSHTGRNVAFASSDDPVRIWDTVTGKLLHKLEALGPYSLAIAFSPDDRYFAHQSRNRTISIYNARTGESQNTLERHPQPETLAFSGDSKCLATASVAGTIKLWDVETAQLMKTIPINPVVKELSFSTDGTYLETEKGHIQIREPIEDAFHNSPPPRYYWRISGEWIMEGTRKMLWLPPDFRTECTAHRDGLFILGRASGEFTFLEFAQGKVVTDVEG